jgi:hypothetical protein
LYTLAVKFDSDAADHKIHFTILFINRFPNPYFFFIHQLQHLVQLVILKRIAVLEGNHIDFFNPWHTRNSLKTEALGLRGIMLESVMQVQHPYART